MSCISAPRPGRPLDVSPLMPPTLMIVVDTEEEFQWRQPHDPGNVSVEAMKHVHRLHEIVDRFGARPCYVVDYPVASQQQGFEPLLELAASQRCEVGAHLHPWVNPPMRETIDVLNSYPGNLPAALERDKLAVLTETIEQAFGRRPETYKAGRYGVGANTFAILEALGYRIDLSPTPTFDYSADGGPNFDTYPNEPFWWGVPGSVLCFPCTGAFLGLLRRQGSALHPLSSGSVGRKLRIPGVLARLRLLDRIRLSPEGFTLDEMRRLAGTLVAQGTRILTLSLHSPSLDVGHTPYVRTKEELARFLGRIEAFLEFFVSVLNGRFMTPGELREELIAPAAGQSDQLCEAPPARVPRSSGTGTNSSSMGNSHFSA